MDIKLIDHMQWLGLNLYDPLVCVFLVNGFCRFVYLSKTYLLV